MVRIAQCGSLMLAVSHMKITSIAGPLLILLALGAWIVSQRHSISTLEQENTRLQQGLASSTVGRSTTADRGAPKTALDRKSIDWQEVAQQIRSAQGGYGYLRTTRRLDEGFRTMGFEKLLAALDGIETADLSKNDREMLKQKIRSAIFTHHPEAGLTQFIHLYGDQGWNFSLAGGFARWAKQDPDKAVAWFDAHLASESFDSGKSDDGPFFPTKLVTDAFFNLLGTAPDAAGHLLSTVPGKAQLGALASINMTSLNQETHGAWADLTRKHLSASDQLKAIAWPLGNWSDGDGSTMDLAEVSGYLDRIEASGEEFQACIMKAAEQVSTWKTSGREARPAGEDLDALRDWVGERMPELVDPATAKALAALGAPYSELADLAFRYHKTSGNDEVLISLLERRDAQKNKELARSVAQKLSDETKRNEYLEKFKATPTEP